MLEVVKMRLDAEDDWELEDEAFWDLLEDPDDDDLIIDSIVNEHKEDDGE